VYPVSQRLRALQLLADGGSLTQVSRATGVSRAALREWRDRGPDARPSTGACWVCEETGPPTSSGYARLLGYYLGDGCLSSVRSVHALRVACDRAYPGIVEDVTAAIGEVRPGARVQHVRAPGVVVVQSYWKHWPCLFPQHGPGRKHERTLVLADWQRELVERHPADLLRGLFHSDGCRANNWTRRLVAGEMKRYDYPRWQFTNNSPDIRRWCCEALDLVDVPWRQSSWKTISVSTRAGVARLDELLGLKC
jgi:hypothetical protein